MRKVIVLGGSAGAIKALCDLVRALPADLQAALLAVIHMPERASALPQVLGRCGRFEIVRVEKPQPLQPARIYLPPPDHHLVVHKGCALNLRGPRENRHRPSVDTLFRSAARAYRDRLIGVVLSGSLDDGSAGSLAIKSRGGTVIVQDPADAEVPEMPANVLRQVKTDFCLPLSEIPALLVKLISRSPAFELERGRSEEECADAMNLTFPREKEPSAFTCPDCGGALLQTKATEFRCHVGHRYSLESLSEAHADALERALWVALRRLNEQRAVHETLSQKATVNESMQRRHAEAAANADNDMRLLHEILGRI
jgi:two-component system, chemotaxis family, protein-glutamate methylesterase/glutaminase